MCTSHRKKRMKQIKKAIQRGLLDPDKDDPFELFISSTEIRYCYYKETHKILGNTFGMCILQVRGPLMPEIPWPPATAHTLSAGCDLVSVILACRTLRP